MISISYLIINIFNIFIFLIIVKIFYYNIFFFKLITHFKKMFFKKNLKRYLLIIIKNKICRLNIFRSIANKSFKKCIIIKYRAIR